MRVEILKIVFVSGRKGVERDVVHVTLAVLKESTFPLNAVAPCHSKPQAPRVSNEQRCA